MCEIRAWPWRVIVHGALGARVEQGHPNSPTRQVHTFAYSCARVSVHEAHVFLNTRIRTRTWQMGHFVDLVSFEMKSLKSLNLRELKKPPKKYFLVLKKT